MLRRSTSLFLPAALLVALAACRDSVPTRCRSTRECSAGFACVAGTCRTLCNSDEVCAVDELCEAGACVPNGSPRLAGVYGNGPAACPDATQGLCFDNALLVAGHNLQAATFQLRGARTYDLPKADGEEQAEGLKERRVSSRA